MSVASTSLDDVFINCPFDADYQSSFDAIVFTVFACGFRARSAKEVDDGSEVRFEKLIRIIEECRFGIHDISRTELDDENDLPRFNMPLELGLFLGAKRYGDAGQKKKRAIIFDIEKYRYQRFISDLAGMDVHAHGGNPSTLVQEVRDWLANVSHRKLPSGARVLALYGQFQADLPTAAEELGFEPHELPYADFEGLVTNWLLTAPAP